MQTLLQTYVPVNDLCFLIDAYAQVNVTMAVHYIKERWIGWWHSINRNEDTVVRVSLLDEGSVYKNAKLHISKVNECDGSIEGFVDGKLYCFPPPCTSFDDRVTMFEAHCGEYKVQLEYQFDPNSVLPNYKLKVADDHKLLMDDFLFKTKDILQKDESDQIKAICWKRFYSKEMQNKNQLLLKRFQEDRQGKVFTLKELMEPVLFGQHWFECRKDPIAYYVVGKEEKWSSLAEMLPTFLILLALQIHHHNIKPLHFDDIGFSC